MDKLDQVGQALANIRQQVNGLHEVTQDTTTRNLIGARMAQVTKEIDQAEHALAELRKEPSPSSSPATPTFTHQGTEHKPSKEGKK